jgi:hypothetical protein
MNINEVCCRKNTLFEMLKLFSHKLNAKLSSELGVNCIPNLTSLQLAVFNSNPGLPADKHYPHTQTTKITSKKS